jgi:ABC-type transporter Mla subunit MlaD
MPRFTRRKKNNIKNKTFKRGGDGPHEDRKGVIDIIGDKIGDLTSGVVDKAEDIGLNALGLEKIHKSNENNNVTKNVDQNLEKISGAASGVVSNVENVVNKTSAAIIDNVNEVLGSQTVNESVEEAGKETAEITGKLAETFNEAMDNPEVKADVEEAIKNASEVATVVAKSAEEPIKEVARVSVEAGTDALGAASAGFIKVGTDVLSAIPYVGAIIDLGKIINDGSKAASAVVEAGSEAVETASDAFLETKEKVQEGLKDLDEKKKMAEKISNRTTKSINQFENPLQPTTQSAGGRKTKRRLFKRKAKSKRVRFAT